jgi:TonB family protein
VKWLFILVCMLSAQLAVSQKTEIYTDYKGTPCQSMNARFYTVLEKTDSGWLRREYFLEGLKLHKKALFEDQACTIQQGDYLYFHANGTLEGMGKKVYNLLEGACMRFYANGAMLDSAFYHNGRPVKDRFLWHPNGMMSDSITHANDSIDVQVSWFEDGALESAGLYLHGKMHGNWQFFHPNGKLAAKERYRNNKLESADFFDENGLPLTDTSRVNKEAEFRGGIAGWQRYLDRSLFWPPGYQFGNGNLAVVVVEFTVGADGKVSRAEVVVPFHPVFDNIALRAVKSSPPWQPAISHNRKMKHEFRQPVVFTQPE